MKILSVGILISSFLFCAPVFSYLENVEVPKNWRTKYNDSEIQYVNRLTKHAISLKITAIDDFTQYTVAKHGKQAEYNHARILGNQKHCRLLQDKGKYHLLDMCEVYPESLTSFKMVKMVSDRLFVTSVECSGTKKTEDPNELTECDIAKKIISTFGIYD